LLCVCFHVSVCAVVVGVCLGRCVCAQLSVCVWRRIAGVKSLAVCVVSEISWLCGVFCVWCVVCVCMLFLGDQCVFSCVVCCVCVVCAFVACVNGQVSLALLLCCYFVSLAEYGGVQCVLCVVCVVAKSEVRSLCGCCMCWLGVGRCVCVLWFGQSGAMGSVGGRP